MICKGSRAGNPGAGYSGAGDWRTREKRPKEHRIIGGPEKKPGVPGTYRLVRSSFMARAGNPVGVSGGTFYESDVSGSESFLAG